MAYDIKLVKLVNGELVLGKYDQAGDKITDVALLQTVPSEQGVQMLILPFGYPFEQEFIAELSMDKALYVYAKFPEDIKNKYLEATSNLTLSKPGDLRNLDMAAKGMGAGPGKISNLLKK